MRIRGTKPEFWRSERIASVSWDARLVLKGLESYVDDNGVGKDDIALIIGDLFQRDLVREPSRTLARVSEAISDLHQAGLLWRYDANGTHLLFVSFWETIQRVDKPQSGRFPRPDGTMDYKSSVIRESVANPRESSRTFAPVTEEQGNRGTGEQTTTARANDEPPPHDPGSEPTQDVVVEAVPHLIETTSRRDKPQPTSAARTVVRQVLGNAGYPGTIVDRLAVQVSKLARERHPDALIREALAEWDRRDDCSKPEFLPTVLGDLIKAARATPGATGQHSKIAGWLATGTTTADPFDYADDRPKEITR
jgi:hypothetical protein